MYMRKLSSVRLSGLSKVMQIGKGPIIFSALLYVLSHLYTYVPCVQGCQAHWPLKGFWNVTEIRLLKQREQGDFPGGPVVENLPSNAGDPGWFLVGGTKIPWVMRHGQKREKPWILVPPGDSVILELLLILFSFQNPPFCGETAKPHPDIRVRWKSNVCQKKSKLWLTDRGKEWRNERFNP